MNWYWEHKIGGIDMHGNSEKDFEKNMMNFIFGYKEEKSSLQYDVIWFIIRDCPNLMQITYSRVNNAWLALETPCEALLWNSFDILGRNAHFFVLLILT